MLWLMSAWPDCSKLYARQNEAGTEFEAQRNLMRETFGLDGGGSVASDPGGNVYVAWHGKGPSAGEGESSRQVWIARSADEGRGFGEERPASHEPTGACGCCSFRVFSDSRGVLFGIYRSATENRERSRSPKPPPSLSDTWKRPEIDRLHSRPPDCVRIPGFADPMDRCPTRPEGCRSGFYALPDTCR